MLVSSLIWAIRAEADAHGLTLAAVGERADRRRLLDRMEAGEAREGEVRVHDVAALARVLGLSASALVARAEQLGASRQPR